MARMASCRMPSWKYSPIRTYSQSTRETCYADTKSMVYWKMQDKLLAVVEGFVKEQLLLRRE
eukprot:3692293-Prorocentrum_lima.AAC.1